MRKIQNNFKFSHFWPIRIPVPDANTVMASKDKLYVFIDENWVAREKLQTVDIAKTNLISRFCRKSKHSTVMGIFALSGFKSQTEKQ